MNINLLHIGEYKLEITTANLGKCEPIFCTTRMEAKKKKKDLQSKRYRVTVFSVTSDGGLSFA